MFLSPIVVVDCGSVNAPTNGSVSFSTTTYSSMANISCDEGYTLFGESTYRACTESGVWSDPELECQRKTTTATSFIYLNLGCILFSLYSHALSNPWCDRRS